MYRNCKIHYAMLLADCESASVLNFRDRHAKNDGKRELSFLIFENLFIDMLFLRSCSCMSCFMLGGTS